MAKLVWHCPFLVLFDSGDGRADSRDYREFALIRFDGEYCPATPYAENDTRITKTASFAGWDQWKERNGEGLDCTVTIRRKRNQIVVTMEHLGLRIHNTTTLKDPSDRVFAALTGDLVALTDIRVGSGS